jgi:hypothetical protein
MALDQSVAELVGIEVFADRRDMLAVVEVEVDLAPGSRWKGSETLVDPRWAAGHV